MPSSTSSSKPGALFYARLLVGICALLIVAFGFFSGFLLKHYSETYARVSRQYSEAARIRPAKPGEPTSVLMIGNSLLLEGVDVDRLQKLTSGQMHIYPIFLEATGYYDWFYVHPNGFADGMSGVAVQFLYHEEIAVQLQGHEQEISEARSIQEGFLSKEIPQLPGYEVASAWQSARVVGGDHFDILPF